MNFELAIKEIRRKGESQKWKKTSAKKEKKDKNYYGSRLIRSFQLDIVNVIRNIGNILKIQNSKEKENKEIIVFERIRRLKVPKFKRKRKYKCP